MASLNWTPRPRCYQFQYKYHRSRYRAQWFWQVRSSVLYKKSQRRHHYSNTGVPGTHYIPANIHSSGFHCIHLQIFYQRSFSSNSYNICQDFNWKFPENTSRTSFLPKPANCTASHLSEPVPSSSQHQGQAWGHRVILSIKTVMGP